MIGDARGVVSRRRFLQATGATFAAVAVLGAVGCDPGEEIDRVSFLNWQDYIDRRLLRRFTDETGIEVTYETYDSNDELAQRLGQADRVRLGGRQGASTFDLIVPSDNFVTQFVDADLLEPLDASEIPNLDNLGDVYRASGVRDGRLYGVPWATGTTGIGYDTTVLDEPPGYDVFLDPAVRGRATILDETRDAFAVALFSLGLDPNTTSQADIDAARDRLVEMKQVIRDFDSSSYLDDLANGELVVAQGYSSDVAQARERNPNLAFVLPEAGALRWVDSICIPKGARSPGRATELIDFFLGAEVSAQNSEAIQADTGNAAAYRLLPAAVRDDPLVFPPENQLDRLVFTDDLGPANARYETAWDEVLAS